MARGGKARKRRFPAVRKEGNDKKAGKRLRMRIKRPRVRLRRPFRKKKVVTVRKVRRIANAELVQMPMRIETKPDRLYKMVTSRGKLALPDAAKEFAVEEKRVEEWATMLEDHNLIKMHYPGFGKAVLYSMDYKEREKKEKERVKDAKKIPVKSAREVLPGSRRNKAIGIVSGGAAVVLLISLVTFLRLGSMLPSFTVSIGGTQVNALVIVFVFVAAVLVLDILRRKAKRRKHGKKQIRH